MDPKDKRRMQNLKIMHLNAQGMRDKFTEIKELVSKYHPAILVLNECKIDFDKQKFNIKDYDKLTHAVEQHLATAMYIRRGIRWTETEVTPGWADEDRKIEGTAIKLFTNHSTGEYITIKGVYFRHANQHHMREELEETLLDEPSVIIGDLNLRMRALGHNRDHGLGNIVKKAINDGICNMVHTNQQSRPSSPGDNILDLALITHQYYVTRAKQLESVGSDHLPWMLTLKIEHNIEEQLFRNTAIICENPKNREAYQKTMREGFVRNLPKEITSEKECEKYVEGMETAIIHALDTHAPLIKPTRERLFLPTSTR